jgi:hypothetical protein
MGSVLPLAEVDPHFGPLDQTLIHTGNVKEVVVATQGMSALLDLSAHFHVFSHLKAPWAPLIFSASCGDPQFASDISVISVYSVQSTHTTTSYQTEMAPSMPDMASLLHWRARLLASSATDLICQISECYHPKPPSLLLHTMHSMQQHPEATRCSNTLRQPDELQALFSKHY